MSLPVIASVASAASVTVTKPTGVASGDLLVSFCAANCASASIAPPAGFTVLGLGFSMAAGVDCKIAYKQAGGAEPANYSWTATGATEIVTGMVRVTGTTSAPDAATLQGGGAWNTSGSTAALGPGFVTTPPERVHLLIAAAWRSAATSSGTASFIAWQATGISTDVFGGSLHSTNWKMTVNVFSAPQLVNHNPGSPGTLTRTGSTGDNEGAGEVLLLPAASNRGRALFF
jgi:hypothetical protein